MSALLFVVQSLFSLYVLTFALRVLLNRPQQRGRGRSRSNPLEDFIYRVTAPVVAPLQRLLQPIGTVDTAAVVAVIGVQLAGVAALLVLGCYGSPVTGTLRTLVDLLLSIWFFSLLAYAVLSWVPLLTGQSADNPLTDVLGRIVAPLITPLRKLIPTIGGLDLSVIFAMIAIGALQRLVAGTGFGAIACGGGLPGV